MLKTIISCLFVLLSQLVSMQVRANDLFCEDTPPVGDGWGWNGTEPCQIEDFTPSIGACLDLDGDGYGWNGISTCVVENTRHTTCESVSSDPDGDGWGWENFQSCIVSREQRVCESSSSDSDGDGWGWENDQSCIVSANIITPVDNDPDNDNEVGNVIALQSSPDISAVIDNLPQDILVNSAVLTVDNTLPESTEFQNYVLTVNDIDMALTPDLDDDGVPDYYRLRLYKELGDGSNSSTENDVRLWVAVGNPHSVQSDTIEFVLNPTNDPHGKYFVGLNPATPTLVQGLPENCLFSTQITVIDNNGSTELDNPSIVQCLSSYGSYYLDANEHTNTINNHVLDAISNLEPYGMTGNLTEILFYVYATPFPENLPPTDEGEEWGVFWGENLTIALNSGVANGLTKATVSHEIFHMGDYLTQREFWNSKSLNWFIEGLGAMFESRSTGSPPLFDENEEEGSLALLNFSLYDDGGYVNWKFFSKLVDDCLGGNSGVPGFITNVRKHEQDIVKPFFDYLSSRNCNFEKVASGFIEENNPNVELLYTMSGKCDGNTPLKYTHINNLGPIPGGLVFPIQKIDLVNSGIDISEINEIKLKVIGGEIYPYNSGTERVLLKEDVISVSDNGVIPKLYLFNKKENDEAFASIEIEVSCEPPPPTSCEVEKASLEIMNRFGVSCAVGLAADSMRELGSCTVLGLATPTGPTVSNCEIFGPQPGFGDQLLPFSGGCYKFECPEPM